MEIREFNIQHIDPSSSWIILGPPGSGKTSFIIDIAYYNSYKFPVCRINTGVVTTHNEYCKVFPPITIHSDFDVKEEQKLLVRQTKMKELNHPGTLCLYILDDIEVPSFKKSFLCSLFQKCRHYGLLTILVNQEPRKIPSDLRTSATYIVLFRYNTKTDIEYLYKKFINTNIFPKYSEFKKIYKELTKGFSCMIIKSVNKILNEEETISNCCFYYKGNGEEKNFKFGCKELINWNNARLK